MLIKTVLSFYFIGLMIIANPCFATQDIEPVIIISTPSGASIFLDHVDTGLKTPSRLNESFTVIVLKKEGYEDLVIAKIRRPITRVEMKRIKTSKP